MNILQFRYTDPQFYPKDHEGIPIAVNPHKIRYMCPVEGGYVAVNIEGLKQPIYAIAQYDRLLKEWIVGCV